MNTEDSQQPAIDSPQTRYQCRHIHAAGHRCASPCLRGQALCYFHHQGRAPIDPASLRYRQAHTAAYHLELADPTDRIALQVALIDVLKRVAANTIDPRRASILVYGLTRATQSLPKPHAVASHYPAHRQPTRYSEPESAPPIVEETTQHPTLGTLAPTTPLLEPEEQLSEVGKFLKHLRDQGAFNRAAKQETAQPTELPQNCVISTGPRAESRGSGETPASPQSVQPVKHEDTTILPQLQASANQTKLPSRARTSAPIPLPRRSLRALAPVKKLCRGTPAVR